MADVSDPGTGALCGLASGLSGPDGSIRRGSGWAVAAGVAERDRRIVELEARVAELEVRISRGYVTTSAPIARSLSDTILSQAARIKELEDQLRVCRAAYHGCQP